MAQLKDTVIYGNLRITDTTLTDTLQVTTIKAPSTSGGTTYSVGSNNQALMSNGTSTYWGTPVGTTYSAGTGLSLSGTTFNHSNSVTAVTTAGMLKVKYDAQGHITGSSAFAQADVSTLINLLGSGASNPELTDYYIAQYAGGGTTTTTYHRRPVSALWNTLKALITVSTTGDGNAITSVSIGNDGNNRKLTFTKGSTFSNVTTSSTNGNIKINGTETTVYTHPSHTSKTSGLYKITVDSLGHISATAAVAKGDIPALDYIPTSVSYAEGDVVGGGPGAAKTLVNTDCETTSGTYYPISTTAMASTAEPTKTIANLGKRLRIANSVGDGSNAITLTLGRSSSGSIAAVTGYLELYNSNGGQARITPTSSSTGLNTLRLPASDGTLITSEEVAAGYVTQANGTITTKLTVGTGSGSGQQANGLKIWTKAGANRVLGLYWSYGDTWGTNPAQVSYSNQYDGATPGDKGALLLLPYQAEGTVDDGSKGMWIVKDHAYIDGVELSKVTHNHSGTYVPLTGSTNMSGVFQANGNSAAFAVV